MSDPYRDPIDPMQPPRRPVVVENDNSAGWIVGGIAALAVLGGVFWYVTADQSMTTAQNTSPPMTQTSPKPAPAPAPTAPEAPAPTNPAQ